MTTKKQGKRGGVVRSYSLERRVFRGEPSIELLKSIQHTNNRKERRALQAEIFKRLRKKDPVIKAWWNQTGAGLMMQTQTNETDQQEEA